MSTSNPPPDKPSDADNVLGHEDTVGTAKWLRLLIVTATLLLLLAVCAIAVRLGMAIHHTLLLFALGGLVAYALDPLVEFLRRPVFGGGKKSMSRSASVLTVFAGMLLVFAGALWWLGGQAVTQFKILQAEAPVYRQHALALAHNFDEQFLKPKNVDFSVEQTINTPPPELNVYAQRASKEVLPFIAHTASNIAESAIILVIALYLLIFSSDMKDRANKMLPPRLLAYAVPWEKDVNRILGGFVRGQLILALMTGGAAAIGLWIIGVHLWLIIGIFVVVASLIPVFGPYIGALPGIIAALVGETHMSPIGGAVAVTILFIVLTEVGGKVVYPKLVGHALNLHEVVVLFVLFAGLEVGGLVGTLLAAPVAALSIVTLVHLYRLWQELPEESMADSSEQKEASASRLRVFKRSNPA